MSRSWILIAALAAAPASAADDGPGIPGAGRRLALDWCAECHWIAPDQASHREVGAPAFADVAANPAVTETALRAFLVTPHDVMPNIKLAPAQIDDIVAYLLSLKTP
ncbi:MAG: cytochrome c [Alphaproteobacteria bacterium]|jgi:mono/diheme cytochrome c family protein|nr:cytochrome c [Alphaproteobacteria bacterium]